MHMSTFQVLQRSHESLSEKLEATRSKLHAEENRARGWSPIRCSKLREQIESIEARLRGIEKMMHEA